MACVSREMHGGSVRADDERFRQRSRSGMDRIGEWRVGQTRARQGRARQERDGCLDGSGMLLETLMMAAGMGRFQ